MFFAKFPNVPLASWHPVPLFKCALSLNVEDLLWPTISVLSPWNLVDMCAFIRSRDHHLWIDLEPRSKSQQGHMWKSKLVICWLTIGPRVKQLLSKCSAFYVELTCTDRFYPISHQNTFFATWNDRASEKNVQDHAKCHPDTRSDSLHSLNISASQKTLRVKVVGNWP